jgi:hypothetical protein
LDIDDFIGFLVLQGYAEYEALALAGQAFDDDFDPSLDHLEIRDRNGRPVKVGIDASMGFAGQLRFIVHGQPAAERPSRQADLLRACADALDDGQEPLTGPFLTTHGVTNDELLDLAGSLAIGARLTAWAIENPHQAAAADGTGFMKPDAISYLLRKLNEKAPGPAGGTQ